MLNEPGYENHSNANDLKDYNAIIQHETLRVALVSNVKAILNGTSSIPLDLHEHIMVRFSKHLSYVTSTCREKASLDGKAMRDPFGESRGAFTFTDVLKQFQQLMPATTEIVVVDLTDQKEVATTGQQHEDKSIESSSMHHEKVTMEEDKMDVVEEEEEEEEVPEELKCGVCFDILATPAVLECGHVFCYRCALRW